MKVILLNNNPAVSKLVSVSLNKLGYTFAEIDNLEYLTSNDADLIICDSGLYDSKINYLEYAKNQLFLIPRNRADEYSLAKSQTLQKPFLPTDFIDIVKKILVEIPKPKPIKIVEPEPSNIKVGDEFGEIKTSDKLDEFSDLNSDELLDDINKLQDDFENSSFDDEYYEEQELEQFENLIEVAETKSNKDEFDDELGLDDELSKIESLIDEPKDSNNPNNDLASSDKELGITADEFNLENLDDELAKLDSLEDKTDKLINDSLDNPTNESQAKSEDDQNSINDKTQELSDIDFDLDNLDNELKALDNLKDSEPSILDNKVNELEALDDLSSNEQDLDNLDNKTQEPTSANSKLDNENKLQNIKDITSEYESIELDISAFDELPDGDGEINQAEFDTEFNELKDEVAKKQVDEFEPELESEFKDEFIADLANKSDEVTEFNEIAIEPIVQPKEAVEFKADEIEQTQPVQELENQFDFKDELANEFDESAQKAQPAFLVEEIDLDNELNDLESELAGFESDLANIKSSSDEYELSDLDESQDFSKLADEGEQIKDVEYTENLNKLSSMLDEIDNMDCENDMKNQDLSNSYEASTIDEIEEAAIKEALHEDSSQDDNQDSKPDQSEPKANQLDTLTSENQVKLSQSEQNEIAHVLASQIGEGLGRAFSTSALKDVLKDININISISFEGR